MIEFIREFTITKDIKDILGMKIPEQSKLFVIEDWIGKKKSFLLVRIDNGTGNLDLMPETLINGDEL